MKSSLEEKLGNSMLGRPKMCHESQKFLSTGHALLLKYRQSKI